MPDLGRLNPADSRQRKLAQGCDDSLDISVLFPLPNISDSSILDFLHNYSDYEKGRWKTISSELNTETAVLCALLT